MPISINTNPETELIIGDRFPQLNEDDYAADASSQSRAGFKLRGLTGEISDKQPRIYESFQGDAPDAFMNRLQDTKQKLNNAADRHMNLAQGLKNTATNIAVTKANMNAADSNYHENRDKLFEWAKAQGLNQQELNAEKQKLMSQAQEDVERYHSDFVRIKDDTDANMKNNKPISENNVLSAASGVKFTDPNEKFDSSDSKTTTSSYTPASTSSTSSTTSQSAVPSYGTTTLSSAHTAATGTSSFAPTGGFIPSAQRPGSPSHQANQPGMPMMPGGVPVAGAGVTSAAGTGTGSARQLGSFGAAYRPVRKRASVVPTKVDVSKHVPENSENTSIDKQVIEQAVIIWRDLMDSRWDTGVAVAAIQIDDDNVHLFYATDLFVSLVPTNLHGYADPIDTWDIAEGLLQRASLARSWDALTMIAKATDKEIVSMAYVGFAKAPCTKLDLQEAFAASENASIETMSSRSPHDFVPSDYTVESTTDFLAGVSTDKTITSELAKALMARTNFEKGFTDVMPDGTSYSYSQYLQNALKIRAAKDIEDGVSTNTDYYMWQSKLIDEVR